MLSLVKLSKSYNKTEILKDISFDLNMGESLAISGINGSGKTSLLKIISGLLSFEKGEVLFNGNILEDEPYLRDVAMSFQIPVLWNHLSIRENIEFAINKNDKEGASKLIDNIIEGLALNDFLDKKAANLSGGQAKLVDIARALAKDSSILLFDEPFSHLDYEVKDRVKNFLLSEYIGRKIIIVSTHDESATKQLCKKQALIKEGRIEFIYE